MHKRILAMLLVVALTMTIAVGGTLAYLTDRDSEANVFTVGNVSIDLTEDFAQGATLTPGVTIEKKPVITNTGKNDAWVWLTFSVPSALDNWNPNSDEGSNNNVIHWNPLGATAEGYVNDARVANAIAAGHLPEGTTADDINANNTTWDVYNKLVNDGNAYQEEINGVKYNTYVLPYNKALTPGETTLPGIYNVYLDDHIDIDPNGDWYHVEGGVVTDLDWNSNTNGNPVIYVAAYGVQKEGFETVDDAFAAYIGQWGKLNAEYELPTEVTNVDELKAAIEAGEDVILADGTYDIGQISIGADKDISIGGSKNAVVEGQFKVSGKLSLSGITVDDPDAAVAGEISQFSKSAIAVTSAGEVFCNNVTFNQDLTDSSAISAWWDTGVGTSITAKNCTFNCNGQRPIRATGNVTVENCTFNDPYRYAVQLTAKTSTATEMDKAIINFKNNTIINGENGKAFVYGIQLEGSEYGCNDCVINGSGNTIVNGGTESTMYYCECGKVDEATITWNTEVDAVHKS